MDQEPQLRAIVAQIFEKDAATLSPATSLMNGRKSASLLRGQLVAAIRARFGVRCDQAYTAKTYGDLTAAVLGQHAHVAAPVSVSAPAPAGIDGDTTACGIDIEMIDNLPLEADFWQGAFYREHFTRAEIAYCVSQENPRMHFAARWAAKEALKKCDTAFMTTEMTRIEIVRDAQGKPSLWLVGDDGRTRLPYAVSLTHTPQLAAAIVVRLPAA